MYSRCRNTIIHNKVICSLIYRAIVSIKTNHHFSRYIDTITFNTIPNATGELGFVDNDATKIYSLKIWFKDSIDFRISGIALPMTSYIEPTVSVDNKKLEFKIDQVNITTDLTASSIKTSETETSGDANKVIVDATDIDFIIQPPVFTDRRARGRRSHPGSPADRAA